MSSAQPCAEPVGRAFGLSSVGLEISDQAILLAIDRRLLPLRRNVCTFLSTPEVRREPVLTPRRGDPAAPDNLGAFFYGTVLRDEGRFRMWYYALRAEGETARQGPVCYAESDDGLRWSRPGLGQVEIGGRRDNNAIALPDDSIEGVNVLNDPDDPDPNRRYKMIYNPVTPPVVPMIRTAVSADGIHWTAAPDFAVPQWAEQASLYRHRGLYIVNAQSAGLAEGGRPRGREAYAFVSPDFVRWIPAPAESFLLPEPPNVPGVAEGGNEQPYDQVHLGVGATSLGSVVVGLYGMWHERGWGEGGSACDLGLVVSHDGLHFEEPVKGYCYLRHEESPAPAVPGKTYPTILTQANGILNVGAETRIYYGRWLNAEETSSCNYSDVALATLPRDRWGALGLDPVSTDAHRTDTTPPPAEGMIWSAPIHLPAGPVRVVLNADAARAMSVELADECFTPLARYAGANHGCLEADDGLDCVVSWPGGDLSALAGRHVRLGIRLERRGGMDPRLYAVYLRSE